MLAKLTDAIPKKWENIVQNDINNNGSLSIEDHHTIGRTRINKYISIIN